MRYKNAATEDARVIIDTAEGRALSGKEVANILNEESSLILRFVSVKKDLPPVGAPVILRLENGAVQHVTYALDGCIYGRSFWFAPHFFDVEPEQYIALQLVNSWALLPGWEG